MSRVAFALAVIALVLGGWMSWTGPPPVDLGTTPEPSPPMARACTGRVERDVGGVLSVVSTGDSPIRVDVLGTDANPAEFPPAGATLPLDELIPGGLAGILIDPPTAETGATVVLSGGGTAAVGCTPPGIDRLLVVGSSTRNGEHLELRLINPYAVEAVVEIRSVSENGIDNASELASVIVPAGAVVTRDLANLLPLRESLAIDLTVASGAVHVEAAQAGAGDQMLLEGVVPAEELWFAVGPVGDSTPVVEVFNPNPAASDVRLDVYTASGTIETPLDEPVAGTKLVQVPLDSGAVGVRVTATGPIGAALVYEAQGIRAGTPGVARTGSRWLLPGVDTVWLFNPGEVPLQVTFDGRSAVELPPLGGAVVASAGPIVDATGDIVAFGVVGGDGGVGLVAGAPFGDAVDR